MSVLILIYPVISSCGFRKLINIFWIVQKLGWYRGRNAAHVHSVFFSPWTSGRPLHCFYTSGETLTLLILESFNTSVQEKVSFIWSVAVSPPSFPVPTQRICLPHSSWRFLWPREQSSRWCAYPPDTECCCLLACHPALYKLNRVIKNKIEC